MNWSILFLSFLFWINQNTFFGWNRTPQSSSEVLADGIVFILVAMSVMK